jgi:hypothetical protein
MLKRKAFPFPMNRDHTGEDKACAKTGAYFQVIKGFLVSFAMLRGITPQGLNNIDILEVREEP